jgi:carboxymethylenebutenolidase
MALDRERAVTEITAAARYLESRSQSPKVGVVGWCMGGGLSLSSAAHDSGKTIAACVAFYGRPLDASDTAKLRVPILGLYGEHDHGIPPDAVHTFEKELEQAHAPHEIHIYPKAGHAFFNETRPEAYNAAAAQDAWKRTLDWYDKYLK